MKGDALANMLQDRRILVIIVAVIVIIAAAAAYVMLKDDGKGGSDDPSDGLTIDNERTISEDMVIEGDLVITDKGKLTLADGATISMLGPNAKIDVKGTFDATDGQVQFVSEDKDGNYTPIYENGANETRSVASTGTFTMNADDFYSSDFLGNVEGIIAFVNGAIYASGENVVLTTVAAAAAATGNIEVFGAVSESSNITISGTEVLTIMEDANVTLGTVTIGATTSETADVVINGKLTGSITASNIGAVKLAAASGITVDRATTGTGASAVTDLVIDGTLAGAVNITSGTVDVGTLTVNGTGNTVSVDKGATLMLAEDAELIAGASSNGQSTSVTVDGAIVLDGGSIEPVSTSVKTFIGVAGTMSVLKSAAVDGTINLSGSMSIGVKPTTFSTQYDNNVTLGGNIAFLQNAYVKVYGDGTLETNATAMKSTVFNYDKVQYMTVYTLSTTLTVATVLSGETFMNGTTTVTAASTFSNWNEQYDLTGAYATNADLIGKSTSHEVYYCSTPVTITFDIASGTSVTIGDGDMKIDKDVGVKLVNDEEYAIKLSTGATAKYGTEVVEDTFKVDSKTTSFTVSSTA